MGYSVGVVEYEDRHPSIDKLLEEADQLMYEQKRTRKESRVAVS
ncbi:MAG: hypothetical protein O3B72_05815 [Proteobacteria bacterium]|nr:hypothetical protein [Pseudomonadota bacterium]